MKRYTSYLPTIILLGLAFIAYQLGSTFGAVMTIFAVLVWAVAGLLLVYMVLFRDVKLSLFSADDAPVAPVYVDSAGVYHSGVAVAATDQQLTAGAAQFDGEEEEALQRAEAEAEAAAEAATRQEVKANSALVPASDNEVAEHREQPVTGRSLVPVSGSTINGDDPAR